MDVGCSTVPKALAVINIMMVKLLPLWLLLLLKELVLLLMAQSTGPLNIMDYSVTNEPVTILRSHKVEG